MANNLNYSMKQKMSYLEGTVTRRREGFNVWQVMKSWLPRNVTQDYGQFEAQRAQARLYN
jgi:hypothetical protein